MKNYLEKFYIIEGFIFAIIGILFFTKPVGSLFALTTITAILIIIYSVSRLVRTWKTENKFLSILLAIVDVIFALILLTYPIETIENLIVIYGIWALIRGLFNLTYSFKFHSFGFNVLTLYNIFSIILGLIITFYPYITLFALPFVPYILGIYFIVIAICEIYIGYKL